MTNKSSTILEFKNEILPSLGDILISEQEIKTKVKEIASQIDKDYEHKNPLFVGILKGAGVFLADLAREININMSIDFMAVSSYGASTKTSGIVRILKDIDDEIKDRHVIIVEDIIDSGLTLSYLLKNLKSRKPASLEVCSLLRKENKQKLPLNIKYTGFSIKNKFVVGYGLDFNQKYRQLRDIYLLNNTPDNNGY